MKILELELPHPPSLNHYWRHLRSGRHYVSAEGKDFQAAVRDICDHTQIDEPMEGELRVTIRWRRARKSGDLDNRAKVVLDALQGFAFVNDSQIVELHMFRTDDKKNPGAFVRIEEWPNG